MYVQRNTEELSRNHCCCEKAISIKYSECVCSLNYPACEAHAPYYTVSCSLSGCTKFFPFTDNFNIMIIYMFRVTIWRSPLKTKHCLLWRLRKSTSSSDAGFLISGQKPETKSCPILDDIKISDAVCTSFTYAFHITLNVSQNRLTFSAQVLMCLFLPWVIIILLSFVPAHW